MGEAGFAETRAIFKDAFYPHLFRFFLLFLTPDAAMLSIYNTLAREKTPLQPICPGQVRMYVCGMTVYDFCHLGHARVMVVFDMVYRWLMAQGYEVEYVRNITDIDDKIIARANERGETILQLTDRYIAAMHEDSDALGVLRPTQEPRATDYVKEMLDLIGTLESKGLAYQGGDGDVNFAVRKFPGYGKLSGKSLDDLRAGERVAVAGAKEDPLDFVLWKHAKAAEPAWPSPWGDGRPGWHIECSAMSSALLGNHFDIHGGGADLQFPHHENEIAQSEGAHGGTFANVWMHNGFIRVEKDGIEEKMSKSLGNFFTIRDVLKVYDPEIIRFFILRAQYRSPLNYSTAHLDDAANSLERLYTALRNVPPVAADADWQSAHGQKFMAAMNDDFNTPEAMAVLFDLAQSANREQSAELSGQLKALAGVLGLLQRAPDAFLHRTTGADAEGMTPEQIEARIQERLDARKAKDFANADRVRKELLEAGVVLEDTPQGTIWRRA